MGKRLVWRDFFQNEDYYDVTLVLKKLNLFYSKEIFEGGYTKNVILFEHQRNCRGI